MIDLGEGSDTFGAIVISRDVFCFLTTQLLTYARGGVYNLPFLQLQNGSKYR